MGQSISAAMLDRCPALSIRQPWAWAIVNSTKDVENRSWPENSPSWGFRGPFFVHAAKGMTQHEYLAARAYMQTIGVECPHPATLIRGGIIGMARVVDVVGPHDRYSPWYFGQWALGLLGRKPLDFVACKGQLGFFKPLVTDCPPDAPKKWMADYPTAKEVGLLDD